MNTATLKPTSAGNDQAPWYRHRWPWFIMLGPFLVVVAGLFTAWLAYTRQDALVVDDYYKQGKAINQDLRRDRAAATLGLHAELRYDPAAGRLNGVLAGSVPRGDNKMVMRLVHSTQPQKDIVTDVVLGQDGRFSIALPMLEKARWQIIVEDDEGGWRLTGEWLWPQQLSAKLAPVLAPAE
ncbi:FixH family protein [Noviherbaspirillum galbum]|uniref:FixH family protein n=1 Tax=Noviherbaspirillum galbum TaxID=2709383 RepID=A0A6B3SNI9_9BURK|nr:FixH family protein [Noviherbaspirillum galbum]NEX62287.1 FixH family protein [Noviherbaspirillum galbum]